MTEAVKNLRDRPYFHHIISESWLQKKLFVKKIIIAHASELFVLGKVDVLMCIIKKLCMFIWEGL